MLSPGQELPEFRLEVGIRNNPSRTLETVSASSFSGRWRLYLFLDRSPEMVWAVELAYFVSLRPQFEHRNLKVLGVMMDGAFVQHYLRECREKAIDRPLPMLTDSEGALARAVGVQTSQRASFLVDPSNKVRYACGYDAAVPRNAFEILRILDTLNPPVSPAVFPDKEIEAFGSKPS
ncbi:MAG: peroxiredoxin [Pyrinomonadaceae bacterium]|nr:peroxiredoxin [Pyrinomonadaceae bacterium]